VDFVALPYFFVSMETNVAQPVALNTTPEMKASLAELVRGSIAKELPKMLKELLDYMGEILEVTPIYRADGKLHQYSIKFSHDGKQVVYVYQVAENNGVKELYPIMELHGHSG
jgi:translation elongation factor EF-Ts